LSPRALCYENEGGRKEREGTTTQVRAAVRFSKARFAPRKLVKKNGPLNDGTEIAAEEGKKGRRYRWREFDRSGKKNERRRKPEEGQVHRNPSPARKMDRACRPGEVYVIKRRIQELLLERPLRRGIKLLWKKGRMQKKVKGT